MEPRPSTFVDVQEAAQGRRGRPTWESGSQGLENFLLWPSQSKQDERRIPRLLEEHPAFANPTSDWNGGSYILSTFRNIDDPSSPTIETRTIDACSPNFLSESALETGQDFDFKLL